MSVYVLRLTLMPTRMFDDGSGSSAWVASVSSVFWLYPLIAGTYFVASKFSMGVAEAAFRARNLSVSRPASSTWQDHFFRLLLVLNYSLVCFLLQLLPWIGAPLVFLTMSMVDGYFCFEQVRCGARGAC